MEPIAHVLLAVIPVFGYSLLRYGRITRGDLLLVVAFAALFPDLVDKPLAWWLGVVPSGRMVAHSLLVAIPIILLVLILSFWWGYLRYGGGFAWGYLSHLAGDFYPVVTQGTDYYWFPNLFWPYTEANPDRNPSFDYHYPFGIEVGYELLVLVVLAVYIVYDVHRRQTRSELP